MGSIKCELLGFKGVKFKCSMSIIVYMVQCGVTDWCKVRSVVCKVSSGAKGNVLY